MLFFVTYNVQFESEDGMTRPLFDMVLQYLPIFPILLSDKLQIAFIALSFILLSFQLLFYSFLCWYGLQLYRIDIHSNQRLLFDNGGGSDSGSVKNGEATQMLTAVSLMHMREESEANSSFSNSKDNQKITGSLKIALRLVSIYLVIQNELLMIPSIVCSMIPLICKEVTTASVSNDGSSQISVSEDSYIGIQCWSSLHSVLFVAGIIHLTLIFFSKFIFYFFMHDSYLGSPVPWSQYSKWPTVANQVIFLIYALWYVFDVDKKMHLLADSFALAGHVWVLGIRYMCPLFTSTLVKYVTLTLETCRMWIVTLVIIHDLFDINVTAMTLILSLIIGFTLCCVYLLLINFKMKSILQQGRKTLQKDEKFETYLFALFSHFSKISEDSNVMSENQAQAYLIISGLLQVHLRFCNEKLCPCNEQLGKLIQKHVLSQTLAQELGQEDQKEVVIEEDRQPAPRVSAQSFVDDDLWYGDGLNIGTAENQEDLEKDNPFKRRTTTKRGFKTGAGGLALLTKKDKMRLLADRFVSIFEKLGSHKSRQGNQGFSYENIMKGCQENIDIGISSSQDLQVHWDQIIKYWIKESLEVDQSAITPKFRYLISQFYFQRIQNEFQALFEVMLAEGSLHLAMNLRFQLFRLRKRIESSIVNRYELLNVTGNKQSLDQQKRVDILKVYEFELGFQRLQQLIALNTSNCMKFWKQLLDKSIDAAKMHQTGISISETHQNICRIANSLLILQSSNVLMLLTYSRYLKDIINNEFYAHDIFSLACGQRLNYKSGGHQAKLLGENTSGPGAYDKESLFFGENGFFSLFILRTDFKSLGVIEFANHEVHQMFGYRSDWLIGKDIGVIMPDLIGEFHRVLMARFFERANSPVINKFRELFIKDRDGYLVPVLLYPKVLPNLTRGLKFIGAIKRITQLNYQPSVPGELGKLMQEYLICDKDNYIQNFTSGLSVDLGLFPKMFGKLTGNLGVSGNGNRDIKIEDLSLDFVHREDELKNEGGALNISTKALMQKIERENLSTEEFNYFISRASDLKIFCQLIPLSFGGLTEIKLYRIVLIQRQQTLGNSLSGNQLDAKLSDSNQNIPNAASAEASLQFQQLELLNFGSQSAASSSGSSSLGFNVDKHLKDLKLHITENREPRQIRAINKVLWFLIFLLTISSVLSFSFHLQESAARQSQMNLSLRSLELSTKFLQLQINMRTILDIANDIETGYNNTKVKAGTSGNLTTNRIQYLNELSSNLIEDVRGLNNLLKKENEGSIVVREIDRKGYPYEYQLEPKIAMDQYVTKALELIFEANSSISSLRTQAVQKYPTYTSPINMSMNEQPNIEESSYYSIAKSALYIMSAGWRSILAVLQTRQTRLLKNLENFDSYTIYVIEWLDIVAIAGIILAHMLLAVVIQMIEENKVRVLALYSEVKVCSVKEALNKCQCFHEYLDQYDLEHKNPNQKLLGLGGNSFENFRMNQLKKILKQSHNGDILPIGSGFGSIDREVMQSVQFHEDDDDEDHFKQQWESFNNRLTYFKLDDSQKQLRMLKDVLFMAKLESQENMANSTSFHTFVFGDKTKNADDSFVQSSIQNEQHQRPPKLKNTDDELSMQYNGNSTGLRHGSKRNQQPMQKKNNNDQNKKQNREHDHQEHQNRSRSNSNPRGVRWREVDETDIREELDEIEEEIKEVDEDLSPHDRQKKHHSLRNSHDSQDQSSISSKSRFNEPITPVSKVSTASGGSENETKVGKQEQFQQIQKRNWKVILVLVVISLIMICYFIFSLFFHRTVNTDVKNSADHIKVGLYRQNSINNVFGAMRERIIFEDQNSTQFFSTQESKALQEFYKNEDQIQQQMAKHDQLEDFLYAFMNTLDSTEFCDQVQSSNFEECSTFHSGVLNQGYKQALFSFIKYYTQLNFTGSQLSSNRSKIQIVLNNPDIQAFFLAQETYFQRAAELLTAKWDSKIIERTSWEQNIVKAAFTLFVIAFFIIEFIVIPKIIRQLNETTWRSRGILNLVPNEVFKDMKSNTKIMMILKSN